MSRDYAAFVRNNRTPRMKPLRDALTDFGFEEVASFGSSGNLVFCSGSHAPEDLAAVVSAILNQEVVVRSRAHLAEIVANDPYLGRPEAGIFLFEGVPDLGASAVGQARGQAGERLVAGPGVIYFVGRPGLPGRQTMINLERVLGVRGTMRASRVLQRVLGMM